jgi:mRNA interferase RelE/StbE
LDIKVLQTPTFKRQYKKLDKPIRRSADEAIRVIVSEPAIGEEKSGDLKGTYLYKFKEKDQLYLLAYKYDELTRELRAIGVHENFSRDLKRQS